MNIFCPPTDEELLDLALGDVFADELPAGLLLNAKGFPEFECVSCGEWTEWPADIEDFDIDNPNNQCGRSPRCCP